MMPVQVELVNLAKLATIPMPPTASLSTPPAKPARASALSNAIPSAVTGGRDQNKDAAVPNYARRRTLRPLLLTTGPTSRAIVR